MINSIHPFVIYGFFALIIAFPLILVSINVFKVTNPRQRMVLYSLGLLLPVIGGIAYNTVLTRRCLYYEDNLLIWLCNAVIFIGPYVVLAVTALMVMGVIKAGAGLWYLNRLRRNAQHPGEEQHQRVMRLLAQRCQAWKLTMPEVIFSSRKAFAAFVMGWPRPVLVLNTNLLAKLSDQELEMILTHELVHVRRGDVLAGWGLYILRNLMFYAPFSARLFKGCLVERERICDLETASLVGGRQKYAATLLKVWRLLVDAKPAMGVGFIGGDEMEYRISSLITPRYDKEISAPMMVLVIGGITIITMLLLGIIC